MAKLSWSFLVTIRIDTELARNFPFGIRESNGDSGYNWNSYPNWDINYSGREKEFIEMIWADFQGLFVYDGLNCLIASVRNDE
jgi:hypothetical protein